MKSFLMIMLIPILLMVNYAIKYKPKNYYNYQSLNKTEKFLMIIKSIVILTFLAFIIISLTIYLIKSEMIAIVIVLNS